MTPWCWSRASPTVPMKRILDEMEAQYLSILEGYLQRGGEAELQQAYQLGRRALAEKLGILDMVEVHHRAVSTLLCALETPEDRSEAVRKAGECLVESMSPFEMTHRAFGEANVALTRLNERLEEEAKRIAHSVHDQAGQLLAAIHITLDEISRGLPPFVRERLQEVRKLLDEIEEQLRRISHELRPTVLDDLGLTPALEFLAEGVSKRTKQRITVEGFKGERLPASIETALYRIVQEALNNATKHARATRVTIRLRRTENAVICSVLDNGVGFDPSGVRAGCDGPGLGLIGIRERLHALGGTFEIESTTGRGTDLRVTVPLERQNDTGPIGR